MISIIVPVYNVEKFLNRCVSSILNQTYKNYEVLLIDDGSTDASGRICDSISQNEEKVKVIHQKNQGLSGARNTGIQYAKGEFITFIDSDDFIDERYLQLLLENLINNDADISCCDYLRTAKTSVIKQNVDKKNDIVLTADDIITFFLEKELVSACGKLYKKNIFNEIRFPIGKINEDISTIFKVFMNAKCVVYSFEKLYYYYRNQESITKRKFTSKNMDLIDAWKEVYILSSCYPPIIQQLAAFRLQKAYFTLLGIIAFYGTKKGEKELELQREIYSLFKKNFENIIVSDYISINRKLAMICMRISFPLCCMVGRIIRLYK